MPSVFRRAAAAAGVFPAEIAPLLAGDDPSEPGRVLGWLLHCAAEGRNAAGLFWHSIRRRAAVPAPRYLEEAKRQLGLADAVREDAGAVPVGEIKLPAREGAA